MQRLLIAEGEKSVANLLAGALRPLADAVDEVNDAAAARSRAQSADYALIVLDLMLPGLAGERLCRTIRPAQPECSILALAARPELAAPLLGMRHGFDDYVLKPLEIAQAVTKAKLLLRRPRRWRPPETTPADWRIGAVFFEPATKCIAIGDRRIEGVSATEFELLYFLARSAGSAFSREEVLASIWGIHHPVNMRRLGVDFARLGEKLRNPRSGAPYLVATRDERYMFVDGQAATTESRHGEHVGVDHHP